MSATLIYNRLVLKRAMRTVCQLIGVLMLTCVFLTPGNVRADDHQFSFTKLMPPISKFRLPDLGNISIWKNDMQKAKKAYRKGNYSKARKYLHKALNNGNFIAAWYLGHIHRLGLGVPVNQGKAFHFYRTVALEYDDNGLPPRIFLIALDSLVRVADGYRVGIKSAGIKKDYKRAMRLYNKAATRGHPAAQFGLANMYLKGQAVKPDTKKALRWIKLAARKRFPPALAQLAEFTYKGKYIPKNKVRAVAMYIVATRNSNEALYPVIFDRLDQLSGQLSEENFRQSQNLADRWMAVKGLRRANAGKRPPGPNGPVNLYRPVGQK